MADTNVLEQRPPHVMVQFSDGAHSFLLPAGATMMELADRVDDLAEIHGCALVAIHVDFNGPSPRSLPDRRAYRALN